LAETKEKGEIADVVLRMEDLKKYYEVAASAVVLEGPQEGRKGQRDADFRGALKRKRSPLWANPVR